MLILQGVFRFIGALLALRRRLLRRVIGCRLLFSRVLFGRALSLKGLRGRGLLSAWVPRLLFLRRGGPLDRGRLLDGGGALCRGGFLCGLALFWSLVTRCALFRLVLFGLSLLRRVLFGLLGGPRLLGGKFRGSLCGVRRIIGGLCRARRLGRTRRTSAVGGPSSTGRLGCASGVFRAGSTRTARRTAGARWEFLRLGRGLLRFLRSFGHGWLYRLALFRFGLFLRGTVLLVLGSALSWSGFGSLRILGASCLLLLRRGRTYLARLARETTVDVRRLCLCSFLTVLLAFVLWC